MSSQDSHPGQPVRGQEDPTSTGKRAEKTPPHVAREADDPVIVRPFRSSPAVRLAAWMLALVILLVVLGWALTGVL